MVDREKIVSKGLFDLCNRWNGLKFRWMVLFTSKWTETCPCPYQCDQNCYFILDITLP